MISILGPANFENQGTPAFIESQCRFGFEVRLMPDINGTANFETTTLDFSRARG